MKRYRMRWKPEEWNRLRALVCQGLRNGEIAAALGRPYGTVAVYIHLLGGRQRILWEAA